MDFFTERREAVLERARSIRPQGKTSLTSGFTVGTNHMRKDQKSVNDAASSIWEGAVEQHRTGMRNAARGLPEVLRVCEDLTSLLRKAPADHVPAHELRAVLTSLTQQCDRVRTWGGNMTTQKEKSPEIFKAPAWTRARPNGMAERQTTKENTPSMNTIVRGMRGPSSRGASTPRGARDAARRETPGSKLHKFQSSTSNNTFDSGTTRLLSAGVMGERSGRLSVADKAHDDMIAAAMAFRPHADSRAAQPAPKSFRGDASPFLRARPRARSQSPPERSESRFAPSQTGGTRRPSTSVAMQGTAMASPSLIRRGELPPSTSVSRRRSVSAVAAPSRGLSTSARGRSQSSVRNERPSFARLNVASSGSIFR